jgi:pimeloyl-ACP methyl ester carboxylesterase
MGRYLIDEYRRACQAWGLTAPAAATVPAVVSVPTLLISGEFDPVTPPADAERLARRLPASRHLVVPGAGHGASLGCARDAVVHALLRGSLNGLPAVCGTPATSTAASRF